MIFIKKGNFNLYPFEIFDEIKRNDVLNIGFEGLVGKVTSKTKNLIKLKCYKVVSWKIIRNSCREQKG